MLDNLKTIKALDSTVLEVAWRPRERRRFRALFSFQERAMRARKYDQRNITQLQKRRILERDDYCCMYCFGYADEVDHIIPWSYDHDNSEENLVASCWLCNQIASNKMFRSFSHKREYVITRRYWFQKKKIIPLWTKSEAMELGKTLRTYVESHAILCEDDEERAKVKRILLKDGWRVIGGVILRD